jgi:hypothetical protein
VVINDTSKSSKEKEKMKERPNRMIFYEFQALEI